MKSYKREILGLFTLLLLLDVVFIGFHVAFELADYGLLSNPLLRNPQLSLNHEYSYGNIYQHIKQIVIVLLLFITLAQCREKIYIVWLAVFGWLFADDILLLHERSGEQIANLLDLPAVAGVNPQEYAQLIYFAFTGGAILIALLLALRKSDARERAISLPFLLGMGLLVFFGVFVDQLDSTPLSYSIPGLTSLLITVEEAGELVVFSFLLVYALYVARHQVAPPLLKQLIPDFFLTGNR